MKLLKMTLCGALIGGCLMVSSFTKAEASSPILKEEAVNSSKDLHSTIHELELLFVLMQERLVLMHDLARYKWNQEQNLETLKGELFAVNQDDQALASFLTAQNNAALKMQEQDFELFKKEGIDKFESVKDFNTEILPHLELLNAQIESSAYELMSSAQHESLPDFLKDVSFNSFKQEGIERGVYDIAVEPLFQK